MTATPEPAQRTDAAETTETASSEAAGRLSGRELLSRTAVVVVSYDSAALLERTLARVAEDSPEARIVVVDNYSTPEAREELVALASARGWEAVLPETNTGFGGGMNLGAARARELGADLLVLLNPDAVIARSDLIRLAARAHADRLALVAPVLKDSTGRIVSDGIVVCLADGSMRSRRSPRPIPPGGTHPWLSGACLALSTDLFEVTGGFDARYFLYWEDVDFSARVLAAGGSLDLARDAVAVHDEGGTHSESQPQDSGQEGSEDRSKSDIYDGEYSKDGYYNESRVIYFPNSGADTIVVQNLALLEDNNGKIPLTFDVNLLGKLSSSPLSYKVEFDKSRSTATPRAPACSTPNTFTSIGGGAVSTVSVLRAPNNLLAIGKGGRLLSPIASLGAMAPRGASNCMAQ